jgi:membrane-associated phospholipid phosphatase
MPVASMLTETLRRHGGVLVVAALTLGVAVFVSRVTKNGIDLDGVMSFAEYLGLAAWCLASIYAVCRLVWLGAVQRDPSPLKAFLKPFKSFLTDGPLMANLGVGMAVIAIFVTGFGVLKGAIALLNPFQWDVAFADLDRWLHFGRLPHEYFWWLIEWPAGIFVINFFYNMWFFIMIGTFLIVAAAREDTFLRQQYLMAFMAIWFIAGFLIATGFSSAGPCYFDDLALGDQYKPLMDALKRSSETFTIWALSTQDMLWEGYKGERPGSLGISAFPSLHVATAVLFALYYSERWKLVGVFMWIFAGIIMVGSVVLGWHYAVDGYAGAILAWAIWRVVGLRRPRIAVATAPSAQLA